MALTILIGMFVMGCLSFGIGYYMGTTDRKAVRELTDAKTLLRKIDRQAAQHESLGEPFAVIVRDMIGEHEARAITKN